MISLQNVCYLYDSRSTGGVSSLELELQAGRLYSIIGKSGSGKSTLLKLLAGQLDPQLGKIYFEDGIAIKLAESFESLDTDQSVLSFLVHTNQTDLSDEDKINEARDLLMSFEITHVIDQSVNSLSFGEKQRIWLSSLLINKTKLLLLDEPFNGIDWINRANILKQLSHLCEEREITIVWATQLVQDALTYSHKVALLNYGKIQQFSRGEDIYRSPRNVFTADFTGLCNKIVVKFLTSDNNTSYFASPWGKIALQSKENLPINKNGYEQLLIIRPQCIYMSEEGYKAKVVGQTFSNGVYFIELYSEGKKLIMRSDKKIEKNNINFQFDLESAYLFEDC